VHCKLGMEEGSHLALKMPTVVELVVNPLDHRMRMVVGWVVNPLDRRMPTGEPTVDGHLDLSMLMDPGDRWSWRWARRPAVEQRRYGMDIAKVMADGRVQSLGLLYMTYGCRYLICILHHTLLCSFQSGP
jgi:hypothetical protein